MSAAASPWLERLERLLARFPEHGVSADLAAMAMADLWGLYRLLDRLAEGVSHGATP